jgi:ubiquinone/menaquinone biosynthesis C-methylase UbiE
VGFYADHVLPRALDLVMRGGEFERARARVTAGLPGDVLEIGVGSGRNFPYYPARVQRVIAVDPATVGRKPAARRAAARGLPVEFRGADAQSLPSADESVDSVLSTWTLCTIPDAGQALAEVYRVLRAGGTLYFLEHARSPDPKVARAQRRFSPLHGRVAGGCQLDRPIGELFAGAGLELGYLDTFYLSGPRMLGYTYAGAATKRMAA